MELKDYLTNERISNKFDSPFDLVNHAIQEAKDMVATSRRPRVKTNTDNPALQILEEILQEKSKKEEAWDREQLAKLNTIE